MIFHLDTPISKLPGIKTQTAKRLEKLGLFTLENLLRHFPSRYEDLGEVQSISKTKKNTNVTVSGLVKSFESKRSWKRKLLISEAVIDDGTGYVRVIFFGQRFLEKTFQEGNYVRLSGTMEFQNGERIFHSPEFESASKKPVHTGRIVGIYPETYGITSKWLRWRIMEVLQNIREVKDILDETILERYHLPHIIKAFEDVHFPKTLDHALIAKKRFAFEDMFVLQLRTLRATNKWKDISSKQIPLPKSLSSLTSVLPFELTIDQENALKEIFDDLNKPHPMNRLLNGDVGSGKTAVALLSMLHVGKNGFQSSLLAPTEILAFQHFETARKLLCDSNLSLVLLTRSYRLLVHTSAGDTVQTIPRNNILRAIKENSIHIVIGTHAILQEDVQFSRLALVIIDEQHRFGVGQRSHLQKKLIESKDGISEATPHLLSMTATPIPRTLSLAFFGNLDISLLEKMPKGRKPIQTKIVRTNQRKEIYQFIRGKIQEGRQVYVVLPLVEESEAFVGTKAAIVEHQRLQDEIFPEFHIGLLHGKMKSSEKEEIMTLFKKGDIHILVATSVVEVGVDVPNATIMIIEEAHRFGLSQLHQFRGRIGRGEHESYCFLFAGDDMDAPSRRMKILEVNSSGFTIAEEDLKLRGPGEFFGSRQSGIPDIGMENLTNIKLVTFAKKEAQEILKKDPLLSEHSLILKRLDDFDRNVHLE
ncbi:MAG: ATP-dependent DNA helicase RecG [Candidatus Moraniibacteriota bacterium]|nr:MAG: ATP-dependent DNA helicase RecG [Candidatus Moranbacteria bacterium]